MPAALVARLKHRWRRRARGRAGERKVAAVLNRIGHEHDVRVHHGLTLTTRSGRRGDIDHVIEVRRRPRFIIAIETKAQRPAPGHLEQVRVNARRVSRRYFNAVPQYRIVVHPNSNEPITYDAVAQAARLGLPSLAAYVTALLAGAHPERLAS